MTGWAESARYAIALMLWITLPPAILYWLIVHSLAGFWRRLGPGWTYAALFPVLAVLGYALWSVRVAALAERYPLRWAFVAAGLVLYALAVVIEVKCRKHLKLRILIGVPELDPHDPGSLLTEGIYAHTRNPRYLDLIVGLVGWSLIINYHAIYWLMLATTAGLWLVVLLEERELRERFGAAYDDYLRLAPRFVPRSWSFLKS